ncbi:hypothetical protein L1887_55848 [Cichorium endivia]|nr:hypothetical protein L1887_55848 [Cichorium endivia]
MSGDRSPLETRVLGHHPERLSDAEISEHLLGATEDGIKLVGAVEHLDKLAHTRLCEAAAAKYLDGAVGDLVRDARGPRLEQADLAGEELGLLGVGHLAHLVGHVFEPVLCGLDERDHLRQLLADDGLRGERLAKHLALVDPEHALLAHGAGGADGGAAHDPALVVEVGEDVVDAHAVLADEVLFGHLDIVKRDVGGAGGGGVGGLDLLGLDVAGGARDADHGEALVGLDGGGKVVGEGAVGDPLFGAVDNVVLAVVGEGGGGAEAHDVGAGKGFGDGEADELVAGEDGLDNLLLELVGAKVHHGGQADDHAAVEGVAEATLSAADELLGEDEFVEVVELLALDAGKEGASVEVLAGAHAHGVDAVLAEHLDELDVGTLARVLAALRHLDNVLVDVLAPLALEVAVRVVKVGRVVGGGEPGGLSVGDAGRAAERVWLELGLLALDGADDEALVLGLGEDLAAVEAEEGLGGVLTGDLFVVEDVLTTRVELGKLGDVVDLGVDDDPEVALLVVLGDLLARVLLALGCGRALLLCRHCEGRMWWRGRVG